MRTLREFVSNSESFIGFEFKGNFTISDLFLKMYDVFLNDGVNLLDAHSTYIYASLVDVESNEIWDYEKCNEVSDALSLLRRYKIVSPELLEDERYKVRQFRLKHAEYLNAPEKKARRIACAYTSNENNRKIVFDRWGAACLCCGEEKNMTLDHVVPVREGGENSIENMQPLCMACNSRKSNKTIDYRKEIKKP